MRRVFEALVGGILLADSPGFLDQCEKEPMDAAIELTNQERKDITLSSQHTHCLQTSSQKFLAWSVFLLLNIFAEEESRESRAQTPEFYACFARGRREQRKIKVSFTTTTTRADDGSPPALASKPASTTSADTDTGSPPPPLAAPPNLQQPRELGIPKMCLRVPESLFCSSYSLDEK